MNRQMTTLLLSLAMAASLMLTGCAKKEETDVVQEKIPPDVIQLAPAAIKTVGIQTATVGSRASGGQILTTGAINANENRVFHINSFVSGRIVRDNVILGDRIRQGQTLALVQNTEVAKVQADYLHALHQNEIDIEQARTRYQLAQKNLDRERRLLAEGVSPRKDYQQAEADATLAREELSGKQEHSTHIRAEAKALLSAYGTRPVNSNAEHINTSSPVTAPRGGIITKKNVTLGDMVTPDTVMYEVADLSQIWLNITVFPKDLASIHVDQAVTFTTDSLPGKRFIGRINYIQPAAQETSQTYIARAFMGNPGGLLKPGMFGQIRIDQPAVHPEPWVPAAAVQQYGRESFVFIPLGNGRYRKQTVVLGNQTADGYLVDSGLAVGATVVTQGSFTLKAEMLKGQFSEEE